MTKPFKLAAAFALAAAVAGCSGDSTATRSYELDAHCPDSPADELFEAALCVCGDFDDVGDITVHGTVGVNGSTSMVSDVVIDGDLHAYDGFDSVASLRVSGSLVSTGDVVWVGDLSVEGNLAAGGDLDGVGTLEVGGALAYEGSDSITGELSYGSRADYQAPAGPPCGCDAFDVASAVAAAAVDNRNAEIGLGTEAIDLVGDGELRLPTGVYYFRGVDSAGSLHLAIDGTVAIYIDGSVDSIGLDHIEIADGGSLDLYVAGDVGLVGELAVASADPAVFRLYIGGDEPVQVDAVGALEFAGMIYAPNADVSFVGDGSVTGAVLARHLSAVGRLEIAYGEPSAEPPAECSPSPVP